MYKSGMPETSILFQVFFLAKTGSGPDARPASPLYGSLGILENQEVRPCNHSV